MTSPAIPVSSDPLATAETDRVLSPELYTTARVLLRRMDLSGLGIDATKLPAGVTDRIVRRVMRAAEIVDRGDVPPATPAATFVPTGLAVCPRCGVFRGVETIRDVNDGDPRPACFVDVPPTRAERREIAEQSAELAAADVVPPTVEELEADDPPEEPLVVDPAPEQTP